MRNISPSYVKNDKKKLYTTSFIHTFFYNGKLSWDLSCPWCHSGPPCLNHRRHLAWLSDDWLLVAWLAGWLAGRIDMGSYLLCQDIVSSFQFPFAVSISLSNRETIVGVFPSNCCSNTWNFNAKSCGILVGLFKNLLDNMLE